MDKVSLPIAPKRIESGDSNKPDIMIVEAMIAPEILKKYDDGNGGVLKYMLGPVLEIVKELNQDAIRSIRKAIEEFE